MKLFSLVATTTALAVSSLAYSSPEAGKAIYNQSCTDCHGPAGTGNPTQDQFWKMKIPRLTGDYVQKKSDDALRDVILNGKRKMPPALMGHPHDNSRGKVTAEQVPDLIAYVRSLKK
jgi:mono/diheme cytochrome c family protein